MIALAINRLQEEFSLTFTNVSWLISTYYLASAITQPIMGKMSDLFGRKRLFIIGLSMVALASILAPLSPGFSWLIGFRIIQAIGSSTLHPAGMGIIRNMITTKQARALGILSIFASTSAALGPSIGGFLIHLGDWPAIFFINFPFILLSMILAVKILPKDPPRQQKLLKLDGIGMLLFAMLVISWLLFLLALADGISWWKLALSIVLTVLFYRYENGTKEPFLNIGQLKENMDATLVYVQFILVNIIFYSIFFGVPSYLQAVHQMSTQTTGVIMLSIAGFGIISTPIAGRWIDNQGSKPALLCASAFVITGALLLLTIGDISSAGWIFFVLSVLGISNGFNNLGLQTALFSFVPREQTGAASGLFMTSRFTGTIFSSSLLGIVFGHSISTQGFHVLAIASLILGFMILALSIRMPRRKLEEAGTASN
jgi:MFS family permease